jgi:hypothetical protein
VGAGVNVTILFETLQVVGLSETVRTVIRLPKKTMNLCVYDSEESDHGVGVGVNVTMLFETLQVVLFYESIKRELQVVGLAEDLYSD